MAEEKASYADKCWCKKYQLGPYKLAQTVEVPEAPLFSILDESAKAYTDKVAIFYQGWTMTYLDLKTNADRLASGLADLGLRQGDRVAIILPMSPQTMICSFGVWKAGGVVLLISPLSRAPEIEFELSEAGVETVICLDEADPRLVSLDTILSIRDRTQVRDIIITSRSDFSLEEGEAREIPGTINLRRLIAEADPEPPELDIDLKEDLVLLLFTGGTTGVPKGVMLTHETLMNTTYAGLPWLLKPLGPGLNGKASILIVMPIYHGAGFFVVLQALHLGLRVMLTPDPRDTNNILGIIKDYRPLLILAAPTQLMRLVQMKVGRLPSLIVSTGAPLPLEIASAWTRETQMPITQCYGLSEGGMMFDISGFSKLTGFVREEKHAIGLPGPGVEAKVVDPETGEEVPFGETGELCVSGIHTMKGYWPTVGDGLREGGWVHTGDVVRMDEDGYFFMEDRIKDMINVSGLKVYSVVVEGVLFQHPSTAMAITIGIPDPERPGSERVKAYIQLKDDYKGKVTADEIIAFCKENLPPYAVPKFVEFRDELPMTAAEKPFKRALREEEIAKMKERGELK